MLIRLIIKNDHHFSPEEATVLIGAFEQALHQMQLTDREDPLAMMIAKRIVELAKQGERDPEQLVKCTLETMGA
jgi:hypothetical protein